MLLISKKQLVPSDANLAMVFICKLFQSRLQVAQFKWSFPDLVHVKDDCGIYYACVVLGKPCSAKYVVGNSSIISFTFSES